MDYEDEGVGWIKPFYETYVKISLVILRAVSLATFAVTAAGLPFDNIKVKMMKMTTDESGQMLYKGVGDCVMKVNRKIIFRLLEEKAFLDLGLVSGLSGFLLHLIQVLHFWLWITSINGLVNKASNLSKIN